MHLSNMKANTGFEVEPPVVASELCLHRFPCSLIFHSFSKNQARQTRNELKAQHLCS